MKQDQHIGLVLAALCFCAGVCAAADSSFYKSPGIFSTRPNETKSLQTITRFGPVGMGIELIQPAFAMQIHNIEEGSPAEAAGKLKAGRIIETINGQKLKDIDPRIQLGGIVAAAEATDGVIEFVVKDKPAAPTQQVVVKIPVLGAYGKTWPLRCPRSDEIVRNFADYLAEPGSNPGFGGIGMPFLLSTGEEKDLETVRQWTRGLANKGAPTYAWHLGYGGIPLCEYYLRTGEQSALPTIQKWVDSATKAQFFGGWSGRGGVPSVTYGGGGGHLNAGGTAVVTFLMLAKECGAKLGDRTLLGALRQFCRFAGRGNNPCGNNKPEIGFVDNGKNGNLALAMAAAASLTPGGEQSVYARARDACAITGFYTTSFMLHGHTGGGIGEIWRSAAMGDYAVRVTAARKAMGVNSGYIGWRSPGGEIRQSLIFELIQLLGSWTIIDQVATLSEFNLERQMDPGRPAFTKITFKDKGLTSDALRIWSGDTLMDLDRYQALKVTVKKIGGNDYLFIGAGGFSTRDPAGWQSPLYVMKRADK